MTESAITIKVSYVWASRWDLKVSAQQDQTLTLTKYWKHRVPKKRSSFFLPPLACPGRQPESTQHPWDPKVLSVTKSCFPHRPGSTCSEEAQQPLGSTDEYHQDGSVRRE